MPVESLISGGRRIDGRGRKIIRHEPAVPMCPVTEGLDRRCATAAKGDIRLVRRQGKGIAQVIDDDHGPLDNKRAIFSAANTDGRGHAALNENGSRIARMIRKFYQENFNPYYPSNP